MLDIPSCPNPPAHQALDKMGREWEAAELGILPYRETGTCVVKVEEALSQQLDDHIVMLQSMAFSPYKKAFEERLTKWDQQLNVVSGHAPLQAPHARAGGGKSSRAGTAAMHAQNMYYGDTGGAAGSVPCS